MLRKSMALSDHPKRPPPTTVTAVGNALIRGLNPERLSQPHSRNALYDEREEVVVAELLVKALL